MPIDLGATSISQIRLGATPLTEIRLGSTLVWSVATMFDNFNRADANTLGPNWINDYTSSVYVPGIAQNTARMNMPDGLIFVLGQSAWTRYTAATTPGDDGYLEVKMATIGSAYDGGNWVSQAYRRLSNGASSDGVGFHLYASTVSIVRRVAGVDTVMVACGSFLAGDVLRLQQTGNVHTCLVNGVVRNSWNDSGATAQKGAGFRSMGMRFDGGKDFLGPRQFSPAFDYILAT
jgi:hypothetical protein